MFRIDPVIRSLLVLLACLVALFAFLLGGRFFSFANLQSMAFQLPELGILAVAMMVTMMTGGINLSIITTANLAGITAAFCITRLAGADASSGAVLGITAIAFASAMVVSALVGAANGFVVAHLGVSAILATLGTTTVLEGIGVLVTRGSVISGFPDAVLFIGNGTVFGVPVPLVIFACCAVLVSVLLDRTPWGVGVRMTGSNANATAYSGVDVRRVLMKVYILSGLLCGVAALIMIARFNSARAGYGSSYLLVTVLASVLGGVNPDGGFGKVGGLVAALMVLQVIGSGLNLLGLSPHLAIALWGGILLFVIALRLLRARRAGQ